MRPIGTEQLHIYSDEIILRADYNAIKAGAKVTDAEVQLNLKD